MLNNINMLSFHGMYDVQSVFNFPPGVLQHLRCKSFDHNNSSDLHFSEGGHRKLVDNVHNVFPQEETKRNIIG
jgi:hypothetical protein